MGNDGAGLRMPRMASVPTIEIGSNAVAVS
ncbi:MAG: hypothetical protein QOJ86_1361 [Bradyrhizobium sp.]|jgi:hypothetical protein|nr:hypothetical protein [Bradyrhizobium sp.]